MSDSSAIVIALLAGARGFTPDRAARVVKDAGLADAVARRASGPFGPTSSGVAVLEALADAVDTAAETGRRIEAHVLESLARGGPDFAVPRLPPPQRELVGTVATVVLADLALRRLGALAELPAVEGALERDGLGSLLGSDGPIEARLQRVLTMAGRYLELKGARIEEHTEPAARTQAVVEVVAAFLTLLRRAVLSHAESGSLRVLVQTLESRSLRVLGHDYQGLQIRDVAPAASSGLLPVRPADIVGNDDYLEAGLRLARDVAGYDFTTGRNPKRVNPVLFGLGKPGCGKTVTAHAIGNDFLDFCRARDVPARFIVVRRTDWASSYQNASALNLVRIFEEEVYGFEGVCGVYWPDIDTAFASRSASGLRMEEKQNLGAVFGIFDGTLLPRDGKWFLVCDANTLHMDEAATSRIAQNPFTVTGPTTPAHFVRLMRDLELREVAGFCDVDEAGWERIGLRAVERALSGRGVAAICGNLLAHVQDFELPDEWFTADAARREQLLAQLGQRIDEAFILARIDRWASFHAEAEARDEQARFEQEVDGLVRRLNAGRVAAQRAALAVDALAPPKEEQTR